MLIKTNIHQVLSSTCLRGTLGCTFNIPPGRKTDIRLGGEHGVGCAPLVALRLSALRCNSDIVECKLFVVQVLCGLAIEPHLLLSVSVRGDRRGSHYVGPVLDADWLEVGASWDSR